LFHASMRMILQPLMEAGRNGMDITGGDGSVRRVFPILSSYVVDYPEQCLAGCAKYGTCPKCQRSASNLQNPIPAFPRSPDWTLGVISVGENKNPRTNTTTTAWSMKLLVFTSHFGKDFHSQTSRLPLRPMYCTSYIKGFLNTLLVGATCRVTMGPGLNRGNTNEFETRGVCERYETRTRPVNGIYSRGYMRELSTGS
ncbi:hypothetical protein DFH09DRAFT_944618, partial [Mycena vulgaris]